MTHKQRVLLLSLQLSYQTSTAIRGVYFQELFNEQNVQAVNRAWEQALCAEYKLKSASKSIHCEVKCTLNKVKQDGSLKKYNFLCSPESGSFISK